MSEGKIIDYSKQGKVNRIYVLVLLSFIVVGVLLYNFYENESRSFLVNIVLPMLLFLLSLGMGYGSKKAIDYIPGEWIKRKVWVSFSEYEEMVEGYEDAYGDLYAHPGDYCSCCCMMLIVGAIGVFLIIFQTFTILLINPFIDSILIISIFYTILSVAGFVIGFRIPTIDAEEFFKAPLKGDTYNFARELEGVAGIRAGMNVELGVRAGTQTIFDAEVKSYIQGIPESVQVKVQVSHSGFAYPYLVGTVYKGFPVEETQEIHRIRTKYPALLEYSMDDEVTVIVARFEIPKRSNTVPHVSTSDFRKLAAFLATKLKDNYNAVNLS
ncbi:hypothetical protein EU527_08575 [Candidatus Thorarchaeota archaeon]|nr:MAG: hypothetical protein EU527_08575 [Candidatus Thorarchaeota archaeon]